MFCLSVLYPGTPGSRFDWDYYVGTHMALVHRLLKPLGMVKAEVQRGGGGFPPGTAAPYQAIALLYFETVAALESALSEAGPQLLADQQNYTDVRGVLQISEVV